jgi:6-pyruvoyl-tetrahydropterin synthase
MRAQRIARVFRSRKITKEAVKDAIATLNEAERRLNNGKNWIQEKFYERTVNSINYCAIGAVEATHSDNMQIAKTALILSVPGVVDSVPEKDESLSSFASSYDDFVMDFNDVEGRKFKSIKSMFKRAKNGLKLSLTSEK